MAAITLTPTAVPTGATVKVSGSGFGRKQIGTVTFSGQHVAAFTTNRRGAFSTSFVVAPTAASGPVLVYTPAASVSQLLTVTSAPPPAVGGWNAGAWNDGAWNGDLAQV